MTKQTTKPTKRTIRALKSLYRDTNERTLYKHEYWELSRLIDLGWAAWDGDDDESPLRLTRKGRAAAKKLEAKP